MRPVRKKTYQEHTFALRILLELDGDDLVSLKLEHLSWSCLLGESLAICSPYSTMGKTLFKHIFSYPGSQYRWQASGIWYLLDAQSYSSIHTWYRLNSLKTNLRITPWITPWSSHNLLHCLLLTTLNPTYGSRIVYGQVLHI
jgi:hypothetical protein